MPPGLSAQEFGYLLPEIVVAVGALVLLLLDVALPRVRLLPTLTSLVVLGAAFLVVAPMQDVDVRVANGFIAVDPFAWFLKLLFLAAAVMTVLMSHRYLALEQVSAGEYCFLVLCATLGMMVMAGAVELVTAFIGLETMAISFYVLAGYIKPNPRSNEAAVKYFLLGAFSLAILLYGMSLLYAVSGATDLRAVAAAVARAPGDPRLTLAIVLLVAGLGFKIAAVPFHLWAPDVYEGAPTPVAAFLSVGSKAAAFALILRIFDEGLPAARADWSALFQVLAVLTMTGGNIAALTQSNTKRMLAYSSVAHAGYLLIGVTAGTPRGVAAVLFYLAAYAAMQLGAFAVVVLLRRADAIGDELRDLSGLHARQPLAAFAMLVCLLSLGGMPPTAGFMGKFRLFGAAIDAGYVWLAVAGVLNSVLSLYYYMRLVMFMYLRPADSGAPVLGVSPALRVALGVAVVATLALGLYPSLVFEAADRSARLFQPLLGVAQR